MYICSFSKKETRRMASWKVGALRKFISWKEKKSLEEATSETFVVGALDALDLRYTGVGSWYC